MLTRFQQVQATLKAHGLAMAAADLEPMTPAECTKALDAWAVYDKSNGQEFISYYGTERLFPPTKLKSPEEKFRSLGKGARR